VIGGLLANLRAQGRIVKMRHLKPRLGAPLRGKPATMNPDPHGKPPRSAITSVGKILFWLGEEWYANLFQDKRKELLLCDRYYHDLLVDPIRYRYGGPQWLARLVGKLIPQPMLWLLLDAPTEVLQARKQEVHPKESARQRQAYLTLVQKQRTHAIVNAAQPLEKVIAEAERAITAAVQEYEGHRD
jgi:hypothetical protein